MLFTKKIIQYNSLTGVDNDLITNVMY